MSKKRLEEAIQAGKAIEQGEEIPNYFEKIEEFMVYSYHAKKDGVYSVQFSADRDLLTVGYGDGAIEVLSCKKQAKEFEVRKPSSASMPVTCLRFHPLQQFLFLAASVTGKVYLCSRIDGTCQDIVTEPNNEINTVSFNNDGRCFATAGTDLDVRIYDTNTCTVTQVFEGYKYDKGDHQSTGHTQRIFTLKYHPDHNDVFITGGWDNVLKVWDCRTQSGVMRNIPGPHICGEGIDIKGLEILTASWTQHNALQVYDFCMSRLVKSIPFSDCDGGEFLYAARFCDNNVVVAGGSGTNSCKAINTESSEVLGEVSLGDHPVQALDVSNGGRHIAIGGGGKTLSVARMI